MPALLYYIVLFIQVDLLAARNGIHGMPPAELPRLLPVLRRSAGFVVPLTVLIIWMFFLNRRPEEAGLLGGRSRARSRLSHSRCKARSARAAEYSDQYRARHARDRRHHRSRRRRDRQCFSSPVSGLP